MASCKCGGGQCNCVVTAGANTTVTGAGSTSNPYVVSATAPPANVVTGCGLTGSGSATSPLAAKVAAWPFTCDITDNGSGIYCDPTTGELRADPAYWADFQGDQANTALATPMPVPTAAQQTIDTISIDVTNPDPCRRGLGLLFREVDLDFVLPPNSGAMAGIDGDDMNYFGNQGSGTIINTHSQDNKITAFTLNPGETRTITMSIETGRGSGGATITRIQKSLRAYVWSNRFN
ncbi:hypothetical protein [Streptomyces prunicolor]|uniref:hypothetical protein n=1 Tax=Streptomyces prunicolor TaxID=67348 RepID=UPI00035E9738|nr:hypothetical protein [Streptomyces prunicolor]